MIIAEYIERVAEQLEKAGLSYGHGTDNPHDEAAWLVLFAAGAPLDGSFEELGQAAKRVLGIEMIQEAASRRRDAVRDPQA